MVEKKPNLTLEFHDYLALKKVLFDWADSYDAKVSSTSRPRERENHIHPG